VGIPARPVGGSIRERAVQLGLTGYQHDLRSGKKVLVSPMVGICERTLRNDLKRPS